MAKMSEEEFIQLIDKEIEKAEVRPEITIMMNDNGDGEKSNPGALTKK